MTRRSIAVLALVFLAGAAVTFGGFYAFGHDRASASGPGYRYGMMGGGYGGMMGGSYKGGYGPGMMRGYGNGSGPGYGPGMMGDAFGGGNVQSSVTPAELKAVRDRVEQQLAAWGYKGFTVGEIMAFSNNDYVLIKDTTGAPAFELLADPNGRWLMPEPTMMWNTSFRMMRGVNGGGYGMMGGYGCPYAGGVTGSTGSVSSATQAKKVADAWLGKRRSGEATADATTLPGYYTIDVVKGGAKVGMLSVHEKTGAVWYHSWHGGFIADQDS